MEQAHHTSFIWSAQYCSTTVTSVKRNYNTYAHHVLESVFEEEGNKLILDRKKHAARGGQRQMRSDGQSKQ